jgi:hypothetical protein
MNSTTNVIILAIILGLSVAFTFRYSAPVNISNGIVAVTDGWTGCVTYHLFDEKTVLSCPGVSAQPVVSWEERRKRAKLDTE